MRKPASDCRFPSHVPARVASPKANSLTGCLTRMTPTQRLTAIALAPVLVAQGLYVRFVTPRLPEPPGDRAGCSGDGPPLRLLIAGDSAAAGVGAPDQASALTGRLVANLALHLCVTWRLIARTGNTIRDAIAQLDSVQAEPFDVAVLSIGVNDVTGGTSTQHWLAAQQRLADLLVSRFAVESILLSAIPPMQAFTALPKPLAAYLGRGAVRLNDATRSWASSRPDCEFVESAFALEPELLAADGFHPGPAAYARWASLLADRVRSSSA
jgi:lysophospholipase L1-like esterase